jgi:hypothetical protein
MKNRQEGSEVEGDKKSSVNGVVDIDIYKSTMLKNGKSQDEITETFSKYRSLVGKTFEMFNGESWHRMGDGGIFCFPTPEDAVNACLRLLNNLVAFNKKENRLNLPLFVRIGINEIEEKDIINVPKDERGNYAHPALDIAGKLQKNCPIGKIALFTEVYKKIGVMQRLFRLSLAEAEGKRFFVLIDRPIMPQEEKLLYGLPEEQKRLIPPIPFPTWDKIAPDQSINLTKLDKFFEQSLLVILGETSSNPQSPVSSAATSDAVGMMEVMAALRSNSEVRVGIDEWEDTVDLVSARDILIIGSGIANIYAFALNDIFYPVKFAKTGGRIFDQIVAISNKEQVYFGPHAIPPRDCGLVIISKSPFNLEKTLLWVAGITGMGTQAAAGFMWELVRDPKETLRRRIGGSLSDPIACIVSACVSEESWEIRNYYRRWRILDYKILWAVDRSGKSVNLWKE